MSAGFWAYWLIGCWIVGLGTAGYLEKCPNDKQPTAGELVAFVAIWPAFVISFVAQSTSGHRISPTKCEATEVTP